MNRHLRSIAMLKGCLVWLGRATIALHLGYLAGLFGLLLSFGAPCGHGSPLWGADHSPRPRQALPLDAQKMLEGFLGPVSEEDRQRLEKIEVSIQEERRMGEAAARAFLSEHQRRGFAVLTRGKDVQYLKSLVAKVQPMMKQRDRYRTIEVFLVRAPEVEAKSFPGGTLVFFQGLLETAGSEAALISVVGHELSHLDRGHHLLRVRQMKLTQEAFRGKGIETPDQMLHTTAMMMRIWTRPFRPEEESVADRDGAQWAYRLGYDPREMLKIFDNFPRDRRRTPPWPSFLQSHPDPEARRQAILRFYEELQRSDPSEDLYLGRDNLRRRVPRIPGPVPDNRPSRD